MTDHSIEELRRQYERAHDKARYATIISNLAFERLTSAKIADMLEKFAARGIVPGSRVTEKRGALHS
jgi:hypothetical protein